MQRRFWAIRATLSIMETKPPVPRAILVGIQVPSVDDVAHAASIEELGHLVKTLGYEVVGTMSQKRDATPAEPGDLPRRVGLNSRPIASAPAIGPCRDALSWA
jgi:hypothetical protein